MFIFQMSYYMLYTKLLLLMSGDIETNPCPINSIIQYLSVCHWNLSSIFTDDNFIKIMLLQAYLTSHSLILCVYQKPS